MKKLLTVFVGLAIVVSLGVAAVPTNNADAITLEELIAYLEELDIDLDDLADLVGDTTTAGGTFTAVEVTADLAPGSTGESVRALQQWLNANGYTVATSGAGSPGNESTYFGSLTEAAVGRLQDDLGVPYGAYRGYWGPSTRGAIASHVGTPTTPAGLPEGCTDTTGFSPVTGEPCDAEVADLPEGCTNTTGFSPVTGEPCDGTDPVDPEEEDPVGEITTPGVEGILDVNLNATPGSGTTVREGDTDKSVLGIKVRARNSDIALQRVRIDLGTNTTLFNRILSGVSLYDGNTLLASATLPGDQIKSGDNYYVDLIGFSTVVKAGSEKVLTVKVDIQNTIDSTNTDTYTIRLANQGVRGVDGAGINQMEGSTSTSRQFRAEKGTEQSATLTVSKSQNTPGVRNVTSDTEGDVRGETVLVFNSRAQRDEVKITDIVVTATRTAGTANADVLWLYDGDTAIASADIITNDTATFGDLEIEVAKDTSKTLVLKADFISATTSPSTFSFSIDDASADMTAENVMGDDVSISGSASGEDINIYSSAGIISILGSSIEGTNSSETASSTLDAGFQVKITAGGGSVEVEDTDAFEVELFKLSGGTVTSVGTSSIAYETNDVSASGGTYTIEEDESATFDLVLSEVGIAEDEGSGRYRVQLNSVTWNGNTTEITSSYTNYRTSLSSTIQ